MRSNDPMQYATNALAVIGKIKSQWEAYGHAAAEAYSKAYHAQEKLLKKVDKSLEKQRQINEALLSFALSVLTVAVAGPLAGAIAKKASAGMKAADAAKVIHSVKELGAELFKEGVKGGGEVTKAFLSAPEGNAFEPAGIPPEQYGDKLQGAISFRARGLYEAVSAFTDPDKNPHPSLTEAVNLRNTLLSTDFVKYPPDVDPSDTDLADTLEQKASLSLWMAWGWNRDMKYWWARLGPARNDREKYLQYLQSAEIKEFEPVRLALIDCGVPFFRLNKYIPDGFKRSTLVLDMPAFIEWTFSNEAQRVYFSGLPPHPLGIKVAQAQMVRGKVEASLRRLGVGSAKE